METTSGGDVKDFDLVIVGAGPAGLYAAYYAGFRGLNVGLIDSLEEPGGQVSAMYPTKLIYDVAGFPAIRGQELVDNLVEQAAPFDPTYLLSQRAEKLTPTDAHVGITTHTGTVVQAKAMIITGGIGTFKPRPLPQADGFTGTGILHFVRELDLLADLDIVIVGGGDSAFDWALNLEPIAKSVHLVHRRDRFRAHEHTVAQVQDSTATIHTPAEVSAIHGDGKVEAVEIITKTTKETTRLDAQCLIAALGFTADLGPLKEWGLELSNRMILVDTKMATNVPRIFAAGDIAEYPGKVKLISVGFGEAAIAVNNSAVVIDPDARLFPGHSSETG
ncbi:MAG: NAD(P)/FAD-dependent oxidoreductase [Actinomycetota bacterium]